MGSLTYKGYSIELVSSQTKSGRWLSTAKVHCEAGRISFTAMPHGQNGYASKEKAEEETKKFTREWINRRGTSHK